jgi:hypothetical protein
MMIRNIHRIFRRVVMFVLGAMIALVANAVVVVVVVDVVQR